MFIMYNNFMFNKYFSERIKNTPPSFIRESLKVIQDPEIISFAGGLPNPISFPQKEIQISMNRVSEKYGDKLYQYSQTLGLKELREYVINRFNNIHNTDYSIDNIIITTGSQQALDLLGKAFVNSGDNILIEKPSYLGFLQAFCLYNAKFRPVKLKNDGLDIEDLKQTIRNYKPKLAYLIPNFQNPTGIMYSKQNRTDIFEVIKDEDIILVQDDPYGDLGFDGKTKIPYIGINQTDKNIYLGSFSKIFSPGMRIGYVIAHKDIIRMLETAKQASDLHSNIFCQYIVTDYLSNNDLEKHIEKIRSLYKSQAEKMILCMQKYFPDYVQFTIPKGGMFTWVTLKEEQSALKLFDKAVENKVAFIPGLPFYVGAKDSNTLRLNYTNASEEKIEEGIKRLSDSILNL